MSCASFGIYVKNLVENVAPLGVQYLVVWNEPQNFPKNWANGTAQEFGVLIHQAYVGAHSVDPNIKIMNGGTELIPEALMQIREKFVTDPKLALQQYDFVQSLYNDSEWCDSIDVLDVHLNDNGPAWSPQIIDKSEQGIQNCNGGKFVPVWATELGFPSYQQLQTLPEPEAVLGTTYTSGNGSQAQFLKDTFAAVSSDRNATGIDWTFLVDPPYSGQTNSSYSQAYNLGIGSGLLGQDFGYKDSYYAFQSYVQGTTATSSSSSATCNRSNTSSIASNSSSLSQYSSSTSSLTSIMTSASSASVSGSTGTQLSTSGITSSGSSATIASSTSQARGGTMTNSTLLYIGTGVAVLVATTFFLAMRKRSSKGRLTLG